MQLNQLNLNQLKVFSAVYRSKSMTAAARELHLTQSGVSQHIRQLEDFLQQKLFDRVARTLLPTQSADLLFVEAERMLRGLEGALAKLKGSTQEITGTVNIGTPVEFGNNLVLPALAEFSRENPGVSYSIRYGLGPELEPLLLSGELDFAFVDSFRLHRRFKMRPIYDETLHLCALPAFARTPPEELPFIDYQQARPVAEMWLRHHGRKTHAPLRLRAWGLDAQGVASLIVAGLGAGILPGHLVDELQKQGVKLHLFKGGRTPLVNRISVALLPEKTPSPPAQLALNWLGKRISAR